MNTDPTATVICFASSKGGTGKTTSAVILAMTLAARGHKVAVIDADPNQPIVRWQTAAGQGVPPNLVVVGDTKEDTIIETIGQAKDAGARFVIVDLEGKAQLLVLYAISQADLVIVPTRGSQLDAEQAARVLDVLKRQQQLSGRAIPYRILLTCTSPAIKTRTLRSIEAQLAQASLQQLPAEMNDREAFRAIFSYRTTLAQLNPDEVSNLGKAVANAEHFTSAVLACLEGYRIPEEAR
jgi:chromosome partitioning protein